MGSFVKDKDVTPRLQCDPTFAVLRPGPYRFYFYSHEPNEPPHVHVDRDNLSAKFWLDPVQLARNLGFSPKDLRVIEGMVLEHQQELQEKWDGYFDINR